jgi:predicted PurR-regulated permease PerM
MFALVAFGALFGFVGLLVAVPAAAAVAVSSCVSPYRAI